MRPARSAAAGRGELADRCAVDVQRLAAPGTGRRRRRARPSRGACAARFGVGSTQGRLADEVVGLVELHREHRAGLERRLVGAELGAPGAPAGFDAQRVERVVAGVDADRRRRGRGLRSPRAARGRRGAPSRSARRARSPARRRSSCARRERARSRRRSRACAANLSGSGRARRRSSARADAAEQRARVRAHQREHGASCRSTSTSVGVLARRACGARSSRRRASPAPSR